MADKIAAFISFSLKVNVDVLGVIIIDVSWGGWVSLEHWQPSLARGLPASVGHRVLFYS